MMATNYTFILFPTKSPETKTIYEIIIHGNQVIHRKSLGIKITEKNWDKSKKRVSRSVPASNRFRTVSDTWLGSQYHWESELTCSKVEDQKEMEA